MVASELKRGTVLRMNNTLYRVMGTEYNNPGRGAASMRAQLMDISTGNTQYKIFSAGDSIENIFVDSEKVQYLYGDTDSLHFMNLTTYDQYEVPRSLFGDDALYLLENMELELKLNETVAIDYELPVTLVYTVVEAEIAVAGNTAGAVNKRVKTDTGLSVVVPAFVKEGDKIKVDTRDGSYLGRGN